MTKIEKAFGFAFPPDLQRFHSIARKHRDALFDAGVQFAGPLAMLDGGKLDASLGRWPSDPPELFTVADGDTDGLHWGWVLHEPGDDPGHVAWFYARDGYPIESFAPTLGQAMHDHVSAIREQREHELAEIRDVGEDDADLARTIARAKKLEAALKRNKRFTPKKERVVTLDGLGVRAPKESFARIDSKRLLKDLRTKKIDAWIERGYELIAAKKAGSAVQIARDLLAGLATEKQDKVVLLAIAAYEALGKPLLARTFAPRVKGIRRRVKSKKPPKIDNRISTTMETALLDPQRVERLVLSTWDEQPEPPDLETIATFSNLDTLALRGYKLGDLPTSFAKLKKLRSIELFECALKRFPKVLGKLKLESLEIIQSVTVNRPRKELRVPRALKIPTLQSVHLVACGLRAVPAFVLGAKKLALLNLDGNHLRELPDEIGGLRRIGYLSASENSLTTVPDSLAKLTKLDTLSLRENKIAVAPEVIGKLRLDSLDIGKNPLAKNKEERAKLKKLARKASIYFT